MIIDMSLAPLTLIEGNFELFEDNDFEYKTLLSEIRNEMDYISECILNELNVIKRNEIQGFKFGIEVDGAGSSDNNFKKDPYFKIWRNASNFTEAKPKDRTRISLSKPEYINHPGVPGNMRLNSKEKKALMDILTTEITKTDRKIDGEYPNNVWQYMLACANNVSKLNINDKEYKHINTEFSDYNKLP